MFGNFNEEARLILVSAKEEMSKLKHPYVGSEHLLLAILKNKNNVSKKLKEYKQKFKNYFCCTYRKKWKWKNNSAKKPCWNY